jgi:acetyl esterase/lipase
MTTPSCETRAGLVYATHDGIELAGDLFLPAGNGPFPVLVAVHGGGWIGGARGSYQYWGPYLAACGYATFAISYRLATADRVTYPHAVQDVRAAVQFVRANAAALKLDSNRVALLGNSAGAHLAAVAALAADAPAFAGSYPQDAFADVSADVKVLVGVYGVYDLAQMWQHYQVVSPRSNNLEKFLGTSLLDNRRIYFEASALSHVSTAKSHIAVYLACGTEDDVVDRAAQNDAFLLALKQAGFFVRGCIVQGAGHYWMNDPIDEPESHSGFLAPRLVRFLDERL